MGKREGDEKWKKREREKGTGRDSYERGVRKSEYVPN